MIDRERRNQLAELLRHFVAGLSSNDAFEERVSHILQSRSSNMVSDAALEAIRKQSWFLYSDLHTHHLCGKHELRPEDKSIIARWVMFLYSDLEYEWPRENEPSLKNLFLNLITLGYWNKILLKRMQRLGEWNLWPFIRRSDYEVTLQNPHLLAG